MHIINNVLNRKRNEAKCVSTFETLCKYFIVASLLNGIDCNAIIMICMTFEDSLCHYRV